MPSGNYYRTQAQLFASLAAATSDPAIAERYNLLALEYLAYLAKAEEVEPNAAHHEVPPLPGDDGSDMDRD
jgi:hypothetical protein